MDQDQMKRRIEQLEAENKTLVDALEKCLPCLRWAETHAPENLIQTRECISTVRSALALADLRT
jgi:hypothetical protein